MEEEAQPAKSVKGVSGRGESRIGNGLENAKEFKTPRETVGIQSRKKAYIHRGRSRNETDRLLRGLNQDLK